MKILTASQMQRVDRLTTEKYGVPSLALMETAGQGVVRLLLGRFAPPEKHRIAILCGRGNNGGDGMVTARLLRERGLKPRVLLFGNPEALHGDAAVNYQRLAASDPPENVEDREAWERVKPSLGGTSLFIDGLLGTGLSKPLGGFLLEVTRAINSGFPEARVVAIDLPSGVSADTGELIGEHMRADFSVTFTAPKIAHVFPPACEQVGEWVVWHIGTPPEAMECDPDLSLNLASQEDVTWIAESRKPAAHKGNFGHVLILAGSVGKTGAAGMAGLAALRAGAGLVTVATAKSALPIIASLGMELMTEPLPETHAGTISMQALDRCRLDKLVEGKTTLAIRPGISSNPETAELVRRVVNRYSLPLVLDADGLNAFAGAMDSFRTDVRPAGAAVLTPHPGEMARLTGLAVKEIQSNRAGVAHEFAQKYKLNLVLKGFRTLTAGPDGQIWVNPTGNPGMATGGTGDVLTGLIAGLLAQHSTRQVTQVAAAAVYLHGSAGDLAANDLGQHSMIAGDVLENVSRAFKLLRRQGP